MPFSSYIAHIFSIKLLCWKVIGQFEIHKCRFTELCPRYHTATTKNETYLRIEHPVGSSNLVTSKNLFRLPTGSPEKTAPCTKMMSTEGNEETDWDQGTRSSIVFSTGLVPKYDFQEPEQDRSRLCVQPPLPCVCANTRLQIRFRISCWIGKQHMFLFVFSHIQRIGCQPEKTTLHGGQSRSWSAYRVHRNSCRITRITNHLIIRAGQMYFT